MILNIVIYDKNESIEFDLFENILINIVKCGKNKSL